MSREARHVLMIPLLVWLGLLVLLGATCGYAYWPGAPLKFGSGVLIAFAKAALIALVFMQLRSSSNLVRLAAVTGLAWLSLLFLFSFADFLTR
jgi:cytochrome c oxidase subunit 4